MFAPILFALVFYLSVFLAFGGVALTALGIWAVPFSSLLGILPPIASYIYFRKDEKRNKRSFFVFVRRVLLPAVTVLAVTSVLLNLFIDPTFAQTSFDIVISRMIFLFYSVLVTAFLGESKESLRRIKEELLFVLPGLAFLPLALIYLEKQELFRFLVEEDSVIETAQFIFYLLSAGILFKLGRNWLSKNKVVAFSLILVSLLFLIVAGDEISWGQRIFNISTPEEIAINNTQEEITIHNMVFVFPLVYKGYLLLGFLGGTAWLIDGLLERALSDKLRKQYQKSHEIRQLFVPQWYLSSYFLIAFAYNLNKVYLNPAMGESLWEEPMELLLVSGIFLHLLGVYLRTHTHPRSS